MSKHEWRCAIQLASTFERSNTVSEDEQYLENASEMITKYLTHYPVDKGLTILVDMLDTRPEMSKALGKLLFDLMVEFKDGPPHAAQCDKCNP